MNNPLPKITVKNQNNKDIEVHFPLLGVPVTESKQFETEEALGAWIDQQKVGDEPLWNYLLKNHFQAINGVNEQGHITNELWNFREHVTLPMIQRHEEKILEQIDQYHPDIIKQLQGSIEAKLQGSSEEFDKAINNINDKNRVLSQNAITNVVVAMFYMTEPGSSDYGAEFLEKLEKSSVSQEQKEQTIKLMLGITLPDDENGELKKALKTNIYSYVIKHQREIKDNSLKEAALKILDPVLIAEEKFKFLKSLKPERLLDINLPEISGITQEAYLEAGLRIKKLSQEYKLERKQEALSLLRDVFNPSGSNRETSMMLEASDDSKISISLDQSPKQLALTFEHKLKSVQGSKAKASKVLEMALEEKDFDKAVLLYAASKELEKPKTVKRKVESFVAKFGLYKGKKKAQGFVQRYLEENNMSKGLEREK